LLACSSSSGSTQRDYFDLTTVDGGSVLWSDAPDAARAHQYAQPCSSACQNTLEDPNATCAAACEAIDGPFDNGLTLASCSFGTNRQSLTCVVGVAGHKGGGCIVDG
jgi:hypothetical protein